MFADAIVDSLMLQFLKNLKTCVFQTDSSQDMGLA